MAWFAVESNITPDTWQVAFFRLDVIMPTGIPGKTIDAIGPRASFTCRFELWDEDERRG